MPDAGHLLRFPGERQNEKESETVFSFAANAIFNFVRLKLLLAELARNM